MPEDLEAKAKQLTEELKIAKRHAAQLAELEPEARARVRACIDALLGEKKAEAAK